MVVAASQPIRRFTAADLDRMVQAGIVDEDEPIELLDGVLETVSPQSPDHAWLLDFLEGALREAYGPAVVVRGQKPMDADADSRPEPDVAVLLGPLGRYRARHPTGADALLLVEVALSSLERDHRKASIYARAGVPVLWIVDVEGRRLEVHSHPGPGGYGVVTLLGEGERVALPGTEVVWGVAEVLP